MTRSQWRTHMEDSLTSLTRVYDNLRDLRDVKMDCEEHHKKVSIAMRGLNAVIKALESE